MLKESDKNKCAKKMQTVFIVIAAVGFFIISVVPFLIPIMIVGSIYLFLNVDISIERILKSIGIFDCIGTIKKTNKEYVVKVQKNDTERKEKILQKRQELMRKLNEDISSLRVNKEVIKKEENIIVFDEEEIITPSKIEYSPKEKTYSTLFGEGINTKSKIKPSTTSNAYKKKEEVLDKKKDKGIFSTSGSSIWDEYSSVMDDFKK